MGEKLLAQRMLLLLRETVGARSREAAVALEWASDQRDWLWPGRACAEEKDADKVDWQSLPVLAGEIETTEDEPPEFTSVRQTAGLLGLGQFDTELLLAVAAFQRLPRLSQLRTRLAHAGSDPLGLLGQVAGATAADAPARVRRSAALALGLVAIERDPGSSELQLDWRFNRLLDEALLDEQRLIDGLAGVRQSAKLGRADFIEHAHDFDLLVRLMKGAVARREQGVNVVIHGPPGTGKTELARTLAAEAGATLFAVGEADADGDEPTRAERLAALDRAQRLLARRGGSILLFDEMEDLFAEPSGATGRRRSGSKIFVNRLFEAIAVPVIWTSNSLDCVDPAHLRRLSFVLQMNHPTPKARARIAARAAEAIGDAGAAGRIGPLLESEVESASVAPAALRTAALAGGHVDDAAAATRALLLGLRGGRSLPPPVCAGQLDLSLYESDVDLAELIEGVSGRRSPSDFSLLLTGPPGTGKTAFAAHLARRLDRPLAVKRASDLLSKWVGGTEANIADAFAEARDNGSVLLFDEADSLLLDRNDAHQSWEITQVNELLTWMDNHPLPFVAATNHARRLDPAALRRFVFKIEMQPLGRVLARRAFERFFDRPAPVAIDDLQNLTPGDFAVVKRQLRFRGCVSSGEILLMLRREAEAKPGHPSRLGF